MSSKIDRWKKLSFNSEKPANETSETKKNVLNELSTIPDDTIEEPDESSPHDDVINVNTVYTPDVGVESMSNASPKIERKRGNKDKPLTESFILKVNDNVRNAIENKVTKDMTHKKTSFMISHKNIAKLERFDRAHGGRIKGEFINNLLEEAFNELELDPRWKKILTDGIEKDIDEISRRK